MPTRANALRLPHFHATWCASWGCFVRSGPWGSLAFLAGAPQMADVQELPPEPEVPKLATSDFLAEKPYHYPGPPSESLQLPEQSQFSAYGGRCGPNISIRAGNEATVALEIVAPCRPTDVVRIRHEGLQFDEVLDRFDRLRVSIPVLTKKRASVTVSFADGRFEKADLTLERIPRYVHVGLQWQGGDRARTRSGANCARCARRPAEHVWKPDNCKGKTSRDSERSA